MTMMKAIKKTSNIFTVIDIGNNKVSCLIGTSVKTNDVQVKVLGFGQHASIGISNGLITNMNEIANSIARAVEGAETMAGFPIEKVVCSLSGGRPITKIIRNHLKIDSGRIVKSDLIKIHKINNLIDIDNYTPLSITPIKYYIDKNSPVDNPIGMHTDNLTLDTSIIYGKKNVMQNFSSAIELCHLSAEKFIISPEASGMSTMTKDEREHGAIVIDLGGNITSIGVFINDKIVFSDSIPIGGIHITSDIVRGLGTKSEDAEKIKILYGSALSNETDEYTSIEIPIISDEGEIINQEIPRAMLTAIIKPRIEETFELVKERLNYFKRNSNFSNKVILCGGGANLNNIREFASTFLETNVRIGRPIGLIGLPEIVQTPTFSCLAGLLIKSLEGEKFPIEQQMNLGLFSYLGRIGNWFDKNL
ncbi:cell division protein FtsA [Alphaproteobacteria bacterium]|nr:cell division protein FtsA [Alphaproteobacteria bacterium]